MTDIRCAQPDEYRAIMHFLGVAFGHPAAFFPQHYPMVWREDTTDYARIHMLVERNAIVGMVRVFPLSMVQGKARVRMGGIGAVATAPAARGRGCMNRLMRHALEAMRREGYPLSILWGNRHRYQAFGYENAGQILRMNIQPRGLIKTGVSPLPADVYAGQPEVLAEITAAYDRLPFHRVRAPRDFAAAYQREGLRMLYQGNGSSFGYLALSGDPAPRVLEFGGQVQTVMGITRWILEQEKIPRLTFEVPDGVPAAPPLLRAASGWSLVHAGMVAILELRQTLETFRPQAETLPTAFDADALASCPAGEHVFRLFGSLGHSPFNVYVPPLDTI